MTRTARKGSRVTSLSATPWSQLKASYQKLQNQSDSDQSISQETYNDVDVTLHVTKNKLKKKKDKLSAKATLKKLSSKQLEVEVAPILNEITTENEDEMCERITSKKLKVKKSLSTKLSSSETKVKSEKQKTKSHDLLEEKIPLLLSQSVGSDSEHIQKISVDERIIASKQTSKGQKIVQNSMSISQESIEDPRRQKRIEARRLRRQRRKVCFNCRESGHQVSECTKSRDSTGTGMCFKCGASDHTSKNCRAKVAQGEYPYAKCFVCGEVGHLSRTCPENPRGLYPHGGGCNHCGSVEHFKANCPNRQQNHPKKHQKGIVGIVKGNSISVDAEDSDNELQIAKSSSKVDRIVKCGPKVVTF